MPTNKNSEPPELSSKLQDLFNHKNWSALWLTYNLVRKWPEIVGNDIAKNSKPAYIQNNTLWVYVQNSVLMQHLQPQKLLLLKKINNLFPDMEVKDLRWAMEPARAESKPESQAETLRKAPDQNAKQAFKAMTSTVENKECRKALQKLWRTFHSNR